MMRITSCVTRMTNSAKPPSRRLPALHSGRHVALDQCVISSSPGFPLGIQSCLWYKVEFLCLFVCFHAQLGFLTGNIEKQSSVIYPCAGCGGGKRGKKEGRKAIVHYQVKIKDACSKFVLHLPWANYQYPGTDVDCVGNLQGLKMIK